ncbi:single-strand DNA-binding protein [Kribbella voronezhensis]|uniref:Single-stranded DNA-binding protein n=1 Tax=Kribbella voronezhensis TaxID=2512212 RepID=A0A4R7T8X4_9ACTN|nr:single-stranded DNA-binding protein [Kribbella voronezhensis]TDU87796.1 single-strand DNA-binding protein [Kribbella voronezhensis]
MSVNETTVTVMGWVGGEISYREVSGGFGVANFRIGTTPRHFDKTVGGWVDRPTTWFQVECWKALAENVRKSVQRGHPVLVTGRLKTTEWVDAEGVTKTKTVIDAFSVGHDLARGTTAFTKSPRRPYSADISSLDQDPTESGEEGAPDFYPGNANDPYEPDSQAA